MCKNLLSEKMFDYLSCHGKEIAREHKLLLKELYTEETQESINFEAFFKEYLSNMDSYLTTVNVIADTKDDCPFVIIGSIVEVHDLLEKEDYQYHIVLPYKQQKNTNIDNASCLSPLGKALLFKRKEEHVKIQIPAGELHYSVNKIIVPDISVTTDDKSFCALNPA